MAYETLASMYDLLMDDVNYEQWAEYIHNQLQKHGVPGSRLLDLGCGTGNVTLPMAMRGYEMLGLDASEEMLQIAAEKARNP